MTTFYDQWLAAGDRLQADMRRSALIARDSDIPWVQTRQDARVKLMVSNELGFTTMGSNVLKAEIPVGWHTGKHRHGEESMHILAGEGFSIVEGQRFDWHQGSTLQIPYRAAHQHFNTGNVPALYISGMCFSLEEFVRVASVEQIEDCGENDQDVLDSFPPEESQYYPNGYRAIIHLEQAPTDNSFEPQGNIPALKNQHDFTQYLVVPMNGFKPMTSVSITHLWEEPPYHHTGRHKHLEAVVYTIDGEGYSEMQGEKEHWGPGDVLYVPPAMWEHEHYNESPRKLRQLRIQFGIRFWFTEIWPEGYTNQRVYSEDGTPIEAGAIERTRERER